MAIAGVSYSARQNNQGASAKIRHFLAMVAHLRRFFRQVLSGNIDRRELPSNTTISSSHARRGSARLVEHFINFNVGILTLLGGVVEMYVDWVRAYS